MGGGISKTKGLIKTKSLKGEHRFSSLMKQNKKAKIYAVCALSFASPEKENYFFNICDVITSPEKDKSSANYYCRLW